MIKMREASLVTVAADDAELSERKIGCRFMANALQILPPHSIHRVTEALERLMEDAAADRPFIAALAISSLVLFKKLAEGEWTPPPATTRFANVRTQKCVSCFILPRQARQRNPHSPTFHTLLDLCTSGRAT
jgi:hypothetical protein